MGGGIQDDQQLHSPFKTKQVFTILLVLPMPILHMHVCWTGGKQEVRDRRVYARTRSRVKIGATKPEAAGVTVLSRVVGVRKELD